MKTAEAAISSQSEGVKSLRTRGRLNNFRTGAITDLRGGGTFDGGRGLVLDSNFIQLSLNSDSAQVQTLFSACQIFAMVRISDNGPGWK